MDMPSMTERLFGGFKRKSEEEKLQEREQFKKLKETEFERKDIFALIIAFAELIIPIAIFFGLTYYLIILFLTKVWMR